MRKLIRANLEALGMNVREAVSVEHGMGLLAHDHPDLIILDLDLPDRDALPSLVHMDSILGKRVPIMVLSADPPSRSFRAQGTSMGYLQKPFSVPMLLQQVRGALAETGGSRSVTGDAL